MLPDRLSTILRCVVDEYVKTGEPVASRSIAERAASSVSPATIRSDMVALEEMGYVAQPHTSSGRVPTELGYKYYIEHFVRAERVEKIAKELRDAVNDADSPTTMLRAAARALADMSGNAAIVASSGTGSQVAGLGRMMAQPEFDDNTRRVDVAESLERAEIAIADLLRRVQEDEVTVWIGHENPMGAELASVVVRVRLPNGEIGMLGLMGPLRMQYGRNIGLLQEVKKLIDRSFDL